MGQIERKQYRGKFPPVIANLVADGLDICEQYIMDHALEAARGWDAFVLLKSMRPYLLKICGHCGQLPENTGKTSWFLMATNQNG